MAKKTVLLDTSSAILLYKANLHELIVDYYHVIIPDSVYSEITIQNRAGSVEYSFLCNRKIIWVEQVKENLINYDRELNKLDKGEGDCLKLFLNGIGEFLITDDGAAAKYCQANDIHFINALLVPKILLFSGVDEQKCRSAFSRILAEGRYSQKVQMFAKNVSTDELKVFLPV